MTATAAVNGMDHGFSLSEIHEGRIQKLEHDSSSTQVSVASINGRLDGMDQKVGTILSTIGDMSEKIDPLVKKIQRSEKEDAVRAALDQRAGWWRKTIIALLLTGAGAIMVKLGEKALEAFLKAH